MHWLRIANVLVASRHLIAVGFLLARPWVFIVDSVSPFLIDFFSKALMTLPSLYNSSQVSGCFKYLHKGKHPIPSDFLYSFSTPF